MHCVGRSKALTAVSAMRRGDSIIPSRKGDNDTWQQCEQEGEYGHCCSCSGSFVPLQQTQALMRGHLVPKAHLLPALRSSLSENRLHDSNFECCPGPKRKLPLQLMF